jgi:gliding motility-associated-like protein
LYTQLKTKNLTHLLPFYLRSFLRSLQRGIASFRFCLVLYYFAAYGIDSVAQCTVTAGGPFTICSGGSVALGTGMVLGNSFGNNPTYNWANATPADIASPTVSPTVSTAYNVTISGPAGCTQTATVQVNVMPANFSVNATANTSPNPITICQGQSIDLNSSVANAAGATVTYSWSHPNGYSNNTINPSPITNATTNAQGLYTVTASVGGCSVTDAIDVTVVPAPIASSNLQPFNGSDWLVYCTNPGETSGFVYVSNGLPASYFNAATSYTINWGDATPNYTSNSDTWGTPAAIEHEYDLGLFNLTYSVTTAGCTTTSQVSVFVGNQPASPLIQPPANAQGCSPFTLDFGISGVAQNIPGTIYTITFSDDPSNPLTFDQSNIPTQITHTFTTSSCGSTFQNGSISENNAFGASIQAVNPCGSASGSAGPIRTSEPPTVSFDPSTDYACVGEVVSYDNTSDPGAVITAASCNSNHKFFWELTPAAGWSLSSGSFGSTNNAANWNGWTSGSDPIAIQYSTPGIYTMELNEKNGCPETQTLTHDVCVVNPPTCNFTISPASGCSPLSVTVNNTSVPPTCNGVPLALHYAWTVTTPAGLTYNLAAGSTANSQNPTFVFENATNANLIGTINLQVSPINPSTGAIMNCSANCSQQVTVFPAPDIDSPSPPQTICTGGDPGPMTVSYTGGGAAAPTYQWYSRTTATGAGVLITGATNASYDPPLGLTTTTYYYCVLTFSTPNCSNFPSENFTVNVVPNPVAGITTSTQTLCTGATPTALTASVTNGLGSGTTYQWYSSNLPSGAGPTIINGATSDTYLPPSASTDIYYFVQVSQSGCASDNSELVHIDVYTPPAVTFTGDSATYCQGANATDLSATATGGVPAQTINYQWQQSVGGGAFTNIVGATSSTFDPPTSATGIITYQVIATQAVSGCNSPASAPFTVTVNAGPNYAATLPDQTLCVGGTPAAITPVVQNYTGAATYQWYSNSTASTVGATPITNQTSISYTPTANTTSDLYYFLTTTFSVGGCGQLSTSLAHIIVVADPQIDITTTPQAICVGGTPSALVATASGGTGTITYTWSAGNAINNNTAFTPIAGNNATSYAPPQQNTAGIQYYKVQMTASGSGCGSDESAVVGITINADPIVSDPLLTQTICAGTTPTDLVVNASSGVTGVAYSYQWSCTINSDGSSAASVGSNSNTYTPVVSAAGTKYYFCTVTQANNGCSGTSVIAEVLVNPAPSITSTYSPQNVCVGADITDFIASYSGGTANADVQWYSNTSASNSGGTIITGETSTTFDPPTNAEGNFFYYAVFSFTSGGCAQVPTQVWTVNVTAGAAIDIPLVQNFEVCDGGQITAPLTPTFSGGSGTPTYTWYSNTTPTTSGGLQVYTGPTADYTPPTLSFNTAGPALQNHYYYCEIALDGGGCSSIFSNVYTIAVIADPAVTTQPLPQQTLCTNAAVTDLEVAATGGSGTYTYQWQSSNAGANTFVDIAGETADTFTPPNTTVSDKDYRCIITGQSPGCSSTSDIANVEITVGPSFTTTPTGFDVCEGGTATNLTVAYQNGSTQVAYQWYSSATGNGLDTLPIPLETNPTFTPPTNVAGEFYYMGRIMFLTGGCGSIYTALTNVTIAEDPSISIEPLALDTVCAGGTAASLEATVIGGTGTISYAWYANTTNSTTGGNLVATTSTYSPPNLSTNATGNAHYFYYAVVAFDGLGCDDATTATTDVLVVDDPTIVVSADQQLCQNATPDAFTTVVSGGSGTNSYAWTMNGNPVTGTTATLIPDNTAIGTFTYAVALTQSSPGCSAQSNTVQITFTDAPYISTQPEGDVICSGGIPDAMSVAYTNGSGAATYQWYVAQDSLLSDSVAILNATADNFQPSALNGLDTLYYSVIIMLSEGGCSSLISDTARVIVWEDAFEPTGLIDTVSCIGGTTNNPWAFVYDGGSNEVSYQWYENTTATNSGGTVIPGATSATFEPVIPSAIGQYYYYCEATFATEGCDPLIGNDVMLEIVDDPVVDTLHFTQSICEGTAVTDFEIIITGGAGTASTYWYEAGANPLIDPALNSSPSTTYTPANTPAGTFNYFANVTQDVDGCATQSHQATLVIAPTPTVTTIADSVNYCHQATSNPIAITFINGTGTPDYAWYQIDNGVTTLIAGATSDSYTPSTNTVGKLYYYAELMFNTGGCPLITSDIDTVMVNPYPEVVMTGSTEICIGDSTPLLFNFTSVEGIYTLNIDANGTPMTLSDTIQSTFEEMVYPTITTAYTLEEVYYTDHPECAVQPLDVANVIVHELPLLTMNDNAVCSGTTNVSMGVQAAPAGFPYAYDWTADIAQGFNPANATLANQSVNPPTVSGTDTTYHYTVEVTNTTTGCIQTDSAAITVHPLPSAGLDLDSIGCLNIPIPIANNATGVLGGSYQWLVDGALYSTLSSPADVVFTSIGFHNIEMTAITPFGCTDDTLAEIEIIIPPVAEFSATPDSGCAPVNVSITNISTGQYTTYDWSIDPFASLDVYDPPMLTYEQGDSIVSYYITLTVSNLCGVRVDRDTVKVFPTPVADIYASVADGCTPLSVDFYDNSTGLPDTYVWDLGDGTTTGLANPVDHIYYTDTLPSTYLIIATLTNECGTDIDSTTLTVYPNTLNPFFSVGNTFGCEPFSIQITDFVDTSITVTYSFGNGDYSGEYDPAYTYDEAGSYQLIQEITNGCATASDTVPIIVFETPEPVIELADDDGCVLSEIAFVGSSNTPGSFLWEMGDGAQYTELLTEHTYANPGVYTLTLSVDGPNGCTGQTTEEIEIHPLPTPAFSSPEQVGCTPFQICFTNASSGSVFYEWSFDDGNISADAEPCHEFENLTNQPVLHEVTMTAIDINLCRNSTSMNILVAPVPTSAFTLSAFESCYFPTSVEATNFSVDATGYNWYVDDVFISSNTNTELTFDAVGSYDVGLEAINAYGCTNLNEVEFNLNPLPELSFIADTTKGCVPLEVSFINTSNGANSFVWDFDHGAGSTTTNAKHTFTVPGVFDVSMIGVTQAGCSDTLEFDQLITVYPTPLALFTMEKDTTNVLQPIVRFTSESVGAFLHTWDFGDGTFAYAPTIDHWFTDYGFYPITLTVENQYGCTAQAVDNIVIEDIFLVYVPNAFTPNDDGSNEYFHPVINGKQFIRTYHFWITDRWGTVVYDSTDPNHAWVGNVRNGDYYAESGTYQWQLIINRTDTDNPYTAQGHVIVMR